MKTLFLIFIVVFTACNKKTTLLSEYKGEKIIFGNGGGFSGAVSSILLLENGEIYRMGSSEKDYVLIGSLKKNITKNVFMTYETMGIQKMKLNEPGNRYFFITKVSDEKEYKIQWGKNKLDNNVPKIFYDNMMKLVEQVENEKNKK